MYSATETITAISTPPQLSAIAIIRISGKKSHEILSRIFRPAAGKIIPRMALTGSIFDGQKQIDEVIAIQFNGPNSYTGEDMAEIHCHGSPFVVQKILKLIYSFEGTRLAERGEFTYRAFLNGKMDLTQAEAVVKIIESKSELSLKSGLGQLKGRLSGKAKEWKSELVGILSTIEASIEDYEDTETPNTGNITEKINNLVDDMEKVLEKTGEFLSTDIPVVIVGKPNAGKSSVFNALAGEERVIVTPIAGTTTDIVSETLQWDGLSWKLHDTAGIGSNPTDIIEEIGQSKTHRKLKESEVILFVLDSSVPMDAIDTEIMKKIELVENKLLVFVLNKSDKSSVVKKADIEAFFKKEGIIAVELSAKTGFGIRTLKETMTKLCGGDVENSEEIVVGSMRQKNAIKNSANILKKAVSEPGDDEEVLAHHIKLAIDQIRELLGEITADDVLDEIFSRFCVGK